jgi:DNA polymerase III delta prime subunit
MTDGAQQALRRTMELYSNSTRFALACNNSEKIIEPIQSRCAMLRYSHLTDAQVLAKVMEVCEKEQVSFSTLINIVQYINTPKYILSKHFLVTTLIRWKSTLI